MLWGVILKLKMAVESIIKLYEEQIEIHTNVAKILKKQKRYHDWYWQRGLVEGYKRVIEKLKEELFTEDIDENLTDKELEAVENAKIKFNQLKEQTKHEILDNRD